MPTNSILPTLLGYLSMGYTAIIADDEPIIRMDLFDILTSAGVAVLGEASDGFDVLDLAQRYHPNVVLMDITMPVFDGLTAARQIIEQHLADTVIFITAFCDDKFITQAKEIGGGGYLVKPIQEQALMPAIEIALAQSQRYAEVEKRERAAQQRIEEQKLIDRAKAVVARQKGISEQEALRFMQHESMNKRVAMVIYAQRLLDAYVDNDTVHLAKLKLIERNNLSDRAAYRWLKAEAQVNTVTVAEIAHKVLFAEK